MSIHDSRIGRRVFLASATAAAAVGFGVRPFGRRVEAFARRGTIQADPAAGHGMLLFGDKNIYLSHLPLFSMPVHRYQVLLEATFTKAGADPQAAYLRDRRAHPEIRIYTFDPVPFVLPELNAKVQKRESFTGRVVRGHFERKGNEPIDEGVTATVRRVVHFQQFAKDPAPLPHLQYLLFGEADDTFAVHVVTKPPDFDHVLAVRVLDHKFSAEELGRGVRLTFPGRANTAAQRLSEAPVSAEVIVPGRDTVKLQVQRRSEIYFEEEELKK